MARRVPALTAPPSRQLLTWLREREDEIVHLLVRLVQLESPSREPEALSAALDLMADELDRVGMRCWRTPGRTSGGCIYGRRDPRPEGPVQLVVGHMDTVWPVGTLEHRPVTHEGSTLSGPGAYDMKGGLAQLVFALRAMRELGLEPSVTPLVLINSDEEVGSPESTRDIRRLSRLADRVYVLEPSAGPQGWLKTARKGVGRFTIRIRGEAAHAGLEPERGASAILELGHQIQRLFALNEPSRGVTVNVGMVDGGLRPNVVAPESRAVVDVRVPSFDDARRVEACIRALRPATPRVTIEVEGGFGRPPMERTRGGAALWALASEAARELGIPLQETAAGGASDANTTSLTTPTLDGLGAVGGGAHATDEHVRVDCLAERAALLAVLLLADPLGAAARGAS